MFEYFGPDALLAEIEVTQRQESTLMAHKLAAIAALLGHRIGEAEDADPDLGYAMITGFARTTAEVSAAMNLAPMGASHLVAQAEALDNQLPTVAALLAEGNTDWRTACWVDAHRQRRAGSASIRWSPTKLACPARSATTRTGSPTHPRRTSWTGSPPGGPSTVGGRPSVTDVGMSGIAPRTGDNRDE